MSEIKTINADTILDWIRRAAAKGTRLEIKSAHSFDSKDRLIVNITSASGEVAQTTINEYVNAKAVYQRELIAQQNAEQAKLSLGTKKALDTV